MKSLFPSGVTLFDLVSIAGTSIKKTHWCPKPGAKTVKHPDQSGYLTLRNSSLYTNQHINGPSNDPLKTCDGAEADLINKLRRMILFYWVI